VAAENDDATSDIWPARLAESYTYVRGLKISKVTLLLLINAGVLVSCFENLK
jgi:hypothetical protein